MNKKIKKKLLEFIFGELIEFKVVLPNWFIIFIFLFPFIGYADYILFGKASIIHYAGATLIEIILVWIGFTLAHTKFRKYKKKKK